MDLVGSIGTCCVTIGTFVAQQDVAAEKLWFVAQPLARQITAKDATNKPGRRSLILHFAREFSSRTTISLSMQDDVIKVADKHFVPCLLVENDTERAVDRVINIGG